MKLLTEAPWTLRYRKTHLEEILLYFHQSLRLRRLDIAQLCDKEPRVLSLNLSKNIIPCVRYFVRELEMPSHRFLIMIQKFPAVFRYSLDRIQPIVHFFTDELNTPKGQFVFHLASYPGLLGCSLNKSIRFRVEWLKDVTKTERDVLTNVCMRGFVLFETRTDQILNSHKTLLEALNGDVILVARILRRIPHILAWSSDTIRGRLKILKFRLRRDVMELYHFPSILGMSFGDRVFPRLELMERLEFDHQKYPLFELFGTSDEKFREFLERRYPATRNIEKELERKREREIIKELSQFDVDPIEMAEIDPIVYMSNPKTPRSLETSPLEANEAPF